MLSTETIELPDDSAASSLSSPSILRYIRSKSPIVAGRGKTIRVFVSHLLLLAITYFIFHWSS